MGFAPCGPFSKEAEHLEAWFQAGRGTHLPYLDPATLLDPKAVFPQARTALVGFFPYARPEAVPGAAPGSLKLSRYLWGPDYHMTMKPRLTRLLEAAQDRWPGLEGRVCVDTAPLLERQLAVRAGLGWQGKHTLLIMGKQGSWGFLGVILLSVDLPVDAPFKADLCGNCSACLEACPSQALSPFSLDPARCLTTYTVETEAEPPRWSLRPWPAASGPRAATPARRSAPGTGRPSGEILLFGVVPAPSTPVLRESCPAAQPSGVSSPGGPP